MNQIRLANNPERMTSRNFSCLGGNGGTVLECVLLDEVLLEAEDFLDVHVERVHFLPEQGIQTLMARGRSTK